MEMSLQEREINIDRYRYVHSIAAKSSEMSQCMKALLPPPFLSLSPSLLWLLLARVYRTQKSALELGSVPTERERARPIANERAADEGGGREGESLHGPVPDQSGKCNKMEWNRPTHTARGPLALLNFLD